MEARCRLTLLGLVAALATATGVHAQDTLPDPVPTEQRLRQLEAQNEALTHQLQQLSGQLQQLSNQLRVSPSVEKPTTASVPTEPAVLQASYSRSSSNWPLPWDERPIGREFVQERPLTPIQPGQLGRPLPPGRDYTELGAPTIPPIPTPPRERQLNPYRPGQLGRPLPPGLDEIELGDEGLERARVDLTQGVRFLSPGGHYRIEFHDLTQIDFRSFTPTGSGQLTDNFVVPRQRLYFAGDVGEYFTFYSVLNRGYGALDLLDAYLDFKLAPWLNVRMGRTKTPFAYEYYKISEGDLIAPERSLFIGNLASNRQIGAMAWGRVLDQRLEYALGVFNGPHRSFTSTNDAKSPYLFLNARPFLQGGNDYLRYFNIGTAVNYYRAGGGTPVEPPALTTYNDQSTSATVVNVSPTFLTYNTAAREQGDMLFYSGDITWFCRGLLMMAAYQGGYITYAMPNAPTSGIVVPYRGYNFTMSYFITGEEPITRKELVPLREARFFNLAANPGAWELFARVSNLTASDSVFAFGLANRAQWANECTAIDSGANWYINRYVKVMMDWQLAEFNRPVVVNAANRFTNSTNTFLVRLQLFY